MQHRQFFQHTKIKCLGFNAGCTGFVDAIELIYSFFNSGFSKKAMIINADTYSKYVHNTDRSTRTISSDGALVTMVSKDIDGYKILDKSCFILSHYDINISEKS